MTKTILITGSNSGIGKLTAEIFAENNWQVIATMRNPSKAGNLANHKNIHVYQMDVTDTNMIKATTARIIQDFAKVDVVVNNAGFGVYGAFELATEEEIERQFAVNVGGLMKVTRAWLPHFRENKEGLFVNISSVAGITSYPYASLYISSKWAVEGFTEALSYEVRPFNIRLKLIEPGGFRTNFQTTSIAWTNDPAISDYDEKVSALKKARYEGLENLPDPIEVARKIYEAVHDPTERMRYLVGKDAAEMMAIRAEVGAENYVQRYKGRY